MNDKALIKRCRRGDRSAFDELIRTYYDYVAGFLLKMASDTQLTEDLTQDTFLKMIRNIEKFDPGGSASFGTWLIAIAKNCCIDHLRRCRIRTECTDGSVLVSEDDVAFEVEERLEYEDVLKALDSLPPEQGLPYG